MAERGRPRKPSRSKIIQGTFRSDRAPANEPEAEVLVRIPKAPTFLPADGKKMWDKLAKELIKEGMLTILDVPALEAACISYGLYRQAFRAVTANGRRTIGEYLRGKNSQTVPEFNATMKSLAMFKSLITEFGLTPASRSRVNIPPQLRDDDGMEKLWNAHHV